MVGVALLVLLGCCWFCVLLLGVSAWWNSGILDEVTKASFGRAVTGTAVMARSANEEKKKYSEIPCEQSQVGVALNATPIRLSASTGRRQHQIRFVYGYVWICIGETWGVFTLGDTRK